MKCLKVYHTSFFSKFVWVLSPCAPQAQAQHTLFLSGLETMTMGRTPCGLMLFVDRSVTADCRLGLIGILGRIRPDACG